jgi:hypothetical protein
MMDVVESGMPKSKVAWVDAIASRFHCKPL